jgi:hypothetical protein
MKETSMTEEKEIRSIGGIKEGRTWEEMKKVYEMLRRFGEVTISPDDNGSFSVCSIVDCRTTKPKKRK